MAGLWTNRDVVPTGETIKKEGTGRVTSSFIGISPIPGTADSGDVYKVKVNTELNVVSTVKLPSRTSDTNGYILQNFF